MPSEDNIDPKERQAFPVAFAAGAVIVLILAGGAVLLSRTIRTNTPAQVSLPFGAGESAYAPKIQFQDIQLARSTNMLNQEFTYVGGTLSNGGDRTVAGLEATFEFHDQFNQVVLRETRQLIVPAAPASGCGRRSSLFKLCSNTFRRIGTSKILRFV